MPCYCDIPSADNQAEIERRSKINMFFDSLPLLNDEQIKECKEKGIKRYPSNINDELCKLCKILTKEQMISTTAYYFNIKWPHKTLYDWHVQHCKDDEDNNEITTA